MGNGNAERGQGEISRMKKNILLILLCRYYFSAGLLKFVDILIDLLLGAIVCRVIASIFVQKGSISYKSRIWDLGYKQGNVDANNIEPVHVKKIIFVVSSYCVKVALEALPPTTISMFTYFLS